MTTLKSGLTKIKLFIGNIKFLYTINFIAFITLCLLTNIKLNYGIFAEIILLWTLFIIYVGFDIVIWYIKKPYEYDEDFVNITAVVLFIVSIFFTFVGMASFYEIKETIKTEKYIPINVIKTNNRIIFIGNTNTFESKYISDMGNDNIKICKDENINSWNIRIRDHWYICDK